MAVLTLEKSRFRSVQLDITDAIVKKNLKRINLYIYTRVYNQENKIKQICGGICTCWIAASPVRAGALVLLRLERRVLM